MHRQDVRNRFELDRYQAPNEQIEPIAILDRQLLIMDRDRNLASYSDPLLL